MLSLNIARFVLRSDEFEYDLLSQLIFRQGCEVKSQMSVFSWRKRVGVVTNVYSRKTLEKNQKRGLRILKMRARELFTRGQGINTPHVHYKGRQSLIECAKHDFKIVYFPFLYFLIFWCRQGCCPCSYVSSGAMRNSDLRSSLSLKVCVLHWLYVFFERFDFNCEQKSFKTLDLETVF